MGAAFLPVQGLWESVYLKVNDRFKIIADPVNSGEMQVVVAALKPDATLLHGAKGDEQGNILIPRRADWGLAVRASRRVIATVEERVPGPLKNEADWRLIPAAHITALVHCPGGAKPTEYPGYYAPDEEGLVKYLQAAKTPASFQAYLQEDFLKS